MLEFWISGRPAPFATSSEPQWKALLTSSIPDATEIDPFYERGIVMIFHLLSEKNRGMWFDLDNLVEPVLSVLVNRKKYFQGNRKNLRWWYARKEIGLKKGLRLLLFKEDTGSRIGFARGRKLIFHRSCDFNPRIQRDYDLAEELYNNRTQQSLIAEETKISLHLRFPESVNIGDISSGWVKRIIDGLHPLIGGTKKAPADWKIEELLVEKISSPLLEIKIWL